MKKVSSLIMFKTRKKTEFGDENMKTQFVLYYESISNMVSKASQIFPAIFHVNSQENYSFCTTVFPTHTFLKARI